MTGLTIKNSAGQVVVDMTMNFAQNMGAVDTNSVNGSLNIGSVPAGKTIFYIVVSLVPTNREKGKLPGVTITGSVMSWVYSYNTLGWGNFSANARIFYGYF